MFIVGVSKVDDGYQFFVEHVATGFRFLQKKRKRGSWPQTIGGAKRAFRHFLKTSFSSKNSNVDWEYADNADGVNVKQMDLFN